MSEEKAVILRHDHGERRIDGPVIGLVGIVLEVAGPGRDDIGDKHTIQHGVEAVAGLRLHQRLWPHPDERCILGQRIEAGFPIPTVSKAYVMAVSTAVDATMVIRGT